MTTAARAARVARQYVASQYTAAMPLVDQFRDKTGMPPARGLPLLDWVHRYRAFLIPDRPFDLANHPYLEAIYKETARRVALQKAGQMGLSEYLISYALHACDERKATAFYLFPTELHVSDFSSARLGPAIEASLYLKQIVLDHNNGQYAGANRTTLKRVRNRFLYFRGGKVQQDGTAPQLKSVDADVLIMDELDELDPRAPAIARKRLGHSLIAEERMASTPSYPGAGINAEYLQSDQRRWHIQCEGCHQWMTPTIDDIVQAWDALGRPVTWHGQAQGTAVIACPFCHKPINRRGKAQWVATHSDLAGSCVGYHISKLISPITNLLSIIEHLQSVDDTERKEAYNQDLGEPYKPRGMSITTESLDACRREYAHGPVPGEKTFAGIDVGRVLHMVIRGPRSRETGAYPQRFAGEVGWADIEDLIARYNVQVAVMDALPETAKARELQARYERGKFWLAYYSFQAVGSKREPPANWDWHNLTAHLDRTRTLDITIARFLDQQNSLPAHIRDLRSYYDHLRSPTRAIEERKNGDNIAVYRQNGADHFAHAENYATCATLCPGAGGWVQGVSEP